MVFNQNQYCNNYFETLKSIPDQGVYLLKSDERKEAFIGYSSNIKQALIRNLENNKLFIPEFNFEVLEIVTEKINLLPRAQFYKDQYCNLGYNLINPRCVFRRKLIIDTINDFRHIINGQCLFSVKLVPRTYKSLIVGIFDSLDEAEVFVAAKYCNEVNNIVFADNKLTKEFRGLK